LLSPKPNLSLSLSLSPLRLQVSGLKAMREEALASVGDIDWVDDDDDGAQTSADASASS
jgi:hypothetical protein